MPYVPATSETLKSRYPAFATVSDDTIDEWLAGGVIEAAIYPDDYRARVEMAYAAGMMAELGVLSGAVIPAGVTSFRSADFSASVSESVVNRTGFKASPYGREFIALRRRFFGGPRLVGPVCD
jgi:hypothetical protein